MDKSILRRKFDKEISKARSIIYDECDMIKTGYKLIDERYGGFRKGELILISSDGGIGIRTFAFDTLIYNAINNKIPVLYISFYKKTFAVILDIIYHICIEGKDPLTYEIENNEYDEMLQRFRESPIYIHHQNIPDMDEILEICEKLEPESPQLIIIDQINRLDMSENESIEILDVFNKIAEIKNVNVLVLSDIQKSTRMVDYSIMMYSEDFYEEDSYLRDVYNVNIEIEDHNCGNIVCGSLEYLKTTKHFIDCL